MKIDGSNQIFGSTFDLLAKQTKEYSCLWVDSEGAECKEQVKKLGANQTALRIDDPKYVGQLKTHRKFCKRHGAEAGLMRAQERLDATLRREELGSDIAVAIRIAMQKASDAYEKAEESPGYCGKVHIKVSPGNCIFSNTLAKVVPVDSIGGTRRFPVSMLVSKAGAGDDENKQRKAAIAFKNAFLGEQLIQFGTKTKELSLHIELSL